MSEFSLSQLNDIRRCLLHSERLWDEQQMLEWCDIEMPFGKHIGKKLGDVPLKYLDETVSVMPPTYFVRLVIRFVDLAMTYPLAAGYFGASVPWDSFLELVDECERISEEMRVLHEAKKQRNENPGRHPS